MNIYEYIQSDHQRILTMFTLLVSTPQQAPEKRAYLMDELRNELLSHMKAELASFYTALANGGEAGTALATAVQADHGSFAQLIEDLAATDPQLESWTAKAQSLRERFALHVSEVEGQGFATAERILDSGSALSLGTKMADLQVKKKREVESDGMPTDQDHVLPPQKEVNAL